MIKIKDLHFQKSLHGCIIAQMLLLNSISSKLIKIPLFKLQTIITLVLSIIITMISNLLKIFCQEISLSLSHSQIYPPLYKIRSIKKDMDFIHLLPKQLIFISITMSTMDNQIILLRWF